MKPRKLSVILAAFNLVGMPVIWNSEHTQTRNCQAKCIAALCESLYCQSVMAPRPREEPVASSLPGLWKYPTYRDNLLKSGALWLKGKQEDDGAEGLWRIHDNLYDLSQWIHNHPGGPDWLTMTKGTDVTEAFESHHIFETADSLLPHFFVRKARTRRNSPYSFKDDGFYRTLKSRVRAALKGSSTGPTFESRLIADLLVSSFLITAVLAASTGSYLLATLSGMMLAFNAVCAHNFFHQKDSFRIFYFDLSLMSSRDWRISHALSHHLYPNSLLDLEISMFEPMIQWLPQEKSILARYGGWLYIPFLFTLLYHGQVLLRLSLAVTGHKSVLRWTDLIGLVVPTAMTVFGGCGVVESLKMWTWIIWSSSFFFGAIGINGGHHHPDIFHDGDMPRQDLDWGLQQLDAVRDQTVHHTNLFVVLTRFGHHALHHLFPTVDHSRLQPLYPILEETCRDFGTDYKEDFTRENVTSIKWPLMQLTRTKGRTTPQGSKKK